MALVTVAALHMAPANAQQCLNASQRGTDDGFFYSFWKNSPGSVDFCLLSGGRYTSQWSGVDNWAGGKGWRIGSRRTVSYSASFNSPSGYLALYGWTTNPLIEYYIVDNWGTYRPPGGQGFMGTVVSDGDTYDVYRTQRVDAPSIIKESDTFDEFWSVRQHQRSEGSITAGNHFDAWATFGMDLGTHNYQIMVTEGTQGSGPPSSGSSDVTVNEGVGSSSS